MKILAIRLRNLASLAGPVALDFTAEPLASAGLFAITGPTGAGKSTLLDALCLALFGAVPRLGNTGNSTKVPDVEGEINTGDPRNLLRRGTGAGYAEVDFLGVDGVRYRARWEANRAREKPGGKLQNSRQSLRDIDTDQLLTTQKNEYRPLLEARLGLNFEQFTRAVMLAQSEFSAFLKSDDNERSELLEKLTDTALYSRLGRRAYDKARTARQQLEALQAQEGAFSALSEQERLALDDRLTQARDALLASQGQRKALEAQQHHHLQGTRLRADLDAATDGLAQATKGWEQLDSDRQDHDHLQALAPQRAPLERHARLASQLQQLEQAIAAAAAQVATTQATSVHTQAQAHAAEQALHAALQQQTDAGPALREAFDRQAAIHHLDQDLAPQQVRQGQLEDEHRQARQALDDLKLSQQHSAATLEVLDTRLAGSADLAQLASAWQAYQPRLRQLVEVAARARQLDTRLPDLDNTVDAATQRQASAQAVLDETAARLGNTSDLGERLRLLTTLIRDNRAALEDLGTLDSQWRRCVDSDERLADVRTQQQRVAELRDRLTQEGKAVKAEHAAASQALDVTVQLLERQHLARLRAGLVPGDPCPVCGSAEHPAQGPQGSTALETLEAQDLAELQAAQGKVQSLADRLAELRAEVRSLMEQQKAIAEQHQRASAQQAAALEALQQLPRQDALLAVTAPKRQAWLTEAVARLRQQIATDEAQLNGLIAAQTQAAAQQNQLRAAEQAVAEASGAAQAHREQLRREQQRFDEELEAFADLLPAAVLNSWRHDPAQAMEALESALSERLNLLTQHQAETLAHAQRQQRIELSGAHVLSLAQQLEALHASLGSLQQRRTELHAALADCLGEHTTADAWQASLEQQATRSRLAQGQTAQAAQQASHAHLAAQGQWQALVDQQANATSERDELAAVLRRWRDTCPALDDARLTRLLAFSPEAEDQLRDRLHAAQTALEHARVLRAEREQRVQAHLAHAMPDALEPQALSQALSSAEADCAVQEQSVAELRAAQLEDDRRRQAREALATQVEAAQAEHRRWGRLSALIGSAEGDRLRKIAQAYNLDLLIRHANAQLLQLVRRYRLQRGGSALGLLVVDTEMANEVRSVHSLSGGETFLVSLALALGLASMASDNLRIESLFIDEGFGSLDPESLQLAMDALDNLQAQGRKVAVISHVQEMHERIPVQIQVRRQGNGLSEVTVVP
jgi:exonuclease SbcC